MHGLLQDTEGGYTDRVAFVAPSDAAWTLPLYEIAVDAGAPVEAHFYFVTPEAFALVGRGRDGRT